ncbi:hypothetical protein V8C40DRAFT_259444 [Trichoderma camerunense]
MDPRSGGSPLPKSSTNKDDSQGLIESLISSYKSWVPELTEATVQPASRELVREGQVEVASSDSNIEPTEALTLPSIAELSRECVSAFEVCMRYEGLMDHQWAENRFADFNLFVDSVGALSTSRASLDSRFEFRPDDLILVQSILTMLKDFLAECINCAEAQSNIAVATNNVDSSLENLALIGVAIRKTGIRSRLARADGRFKPEEHDDLRAFLRIMCLRQYTANNFGIEFAKETQGDTSAQERIDISKELKLSDTQQRLIEVNLRRRNRFLRAQQHSKKLKAYQSDKLEIAAKTRKELGNETAQLPNMTPISQADAKINPTGDPGQKHIPPASTLPETKASTAQGIFQVAKAGKTASQPAMTAITALTAATQYPKAPNLPQDATMFKCPCCCQALPAEFGSNRDLWKKHLSEDISPYTCILPDCSTPLTTYTTVLDWEKHFKREHRPCRVCLLCEGSNMVFSGMEGLVTHIEREHAESASLDFIQTTISWSGVTTIGVNRCPLCDSTGPEHVPEFVQHVLGCIHDFSLYSLPWADWGPDVVSQHVWTCELETLGDDESPMRRWFNDQQDKDMEINRMELNLRNCDRVQVEETRPTNDYFKESENGFFNINSAQDSLEVLKRDSRSSDYFNESESENEVYSIDSIQDSIASTEGIQDERTEDNTDKKESYMKDFDTEINNVKIIYPRWFEKSSRFRLLISYINDRITKVPPVKIAIIDNGIDASLDAFDGKINAGISFCPVTWTGNTGNALYHPYYITSKSLNHGSLVAMLVCAMCPKVKLYICRLDETTTPMGSRFITTESAAEAVEWATDQNVDVMCMSWTIENIKNAEEQNRLENALARADKGGKGIIMVSSASDQGGISPQTWPGESGKCIRIGASTQTSDKSFQVHQKDIDFLFPGGPISLSTNKEDLPAEKTYNGSSFATAVAAGTAGLLLYLDRLAEKWGMNKEDVDGGDKGNDNQWIPLKGRSAMKKMFEIMALEGSNNPSLEMFDYEFDGTSFTSELEESCAKLRELLSGLKAGYHYYR